MLCRPRRRMPPFRLTVRGSYQNGRTKHPTLIKYWEEKKFWHRLGIRTDPRPLEDRPWREVHEYGVIMEEEAAWEKRQREPKLLNPRGMPIR
jgi:hypothetical protein